MPAIDRGGSNARADRRHGHDQDPVTVAPDAEFKEIVETLTEYSISAVPVVGQDGAPPYYVHWLDNGRTTLVFPGPDSHIEHRAGEPVS